jgi:RNA polymerase sigma-70 factor (ECF subfamily)
MEPLDWEVPVLRHFEELSNNETASILVLQKSAGSTLDGRTLKRLKDALSGLRSFLDG